MKTKYGERIPSAFLVANAFIQENSGWFVADIGTRTEKEREEIRNLLTDSPKLLAALVKIVEANETQLKHGGIIEGAWDRAAAIFKAIDEARKLIEEEQK